jgi:putative transcriptional regulator
MIKKRRQKLGLSVGKMAEMIGISRRTLYGYEKGMAKASVSVAYRLEWILGVPLVQPIDIFQSAPRDTGFLARARRMIARHGMMIKQSFIQKVLRKFSQFNFAVTSVDKAPFDFVAKHPNRELNIIGGIVHKKERDMDKRATEIVSVGRIVEFQPILITDGKKISNNDILSISHEDLMKIKSSEELLTML